MKEMTNPNTFVEDLRGGKSTEIGDNQAEMVKRRKRKTTGDSKDSWRTDRVDGD